MEHYHGQLLKQRYRLTHKIGQGGMAAVYLANDENLKRQVVIKQNIFSGSPADHHLFEQEARLMAALPSNIPGVPAVFDYFTNSYGNQAVQYLVMEFIEGEDMDSLLQRASLPEPLVLFWLNQIMAALEQLHRQSPPIIHRDIKPGNILISKDAQTAYLVDFGLAGAGGEQLGTDGFAPPEQYQGQTDARSDIYALGATLYTLLTQQIPPKDTDLLNQIAHFPDADKIQQVSAPVKAAILKAMALKPTDRFNTVTEMREALGQIPTQLSVPANWRTAPTTATGQAGRQNSSPSPAFNWQIKPPHPMPLSAAPLLQPRETSHWPVAAKNHSLRVALAPNNRLISGDSRGQVKFWEITSWQTSPAQWYAMGQHQDWVSCVAVSPDGQMAASGSRDLTIRLWQPQTGQPLRGALEGHTGGNILALAFSPNGQQLFSAGSDQTIRQWPLADSKASPTRLTNSVLAANLAVSQDGQYLLAACQDKRLRLWDINTQSEVELPPDIGAPDALALAVAFSPDGAKLAAAGEDGFLYLAALQEQQTPLEPANWRRLYVLGRAAAPLYALAFSPDSRLVAGGGKDRTLYLWDALNYQMIQPYGPFSDKIVDIAFGPFWKFLVVATANGVISLVRLD